MSNTGDPPWKSDPIEYLVRSRFPSLRPPLPPSLSRPAFPNSDASIQEQADRYRTELLELSRDELERIALEEAEHAAERSKQRADAVELCRSFNQQRARADVLHWAKMSYWTIDEAVALLFGRDPRHVNWETVKPYTNVSAFARQYAEMRDVVQRARVMGQLWEKTIPAIFMAWARRMRVSVPEDLDQAVLALGNQIADWKSLHDKQSELLEQAQKLAEDRHLDHMKTMEAHSQYIEKLTADYGAIASQRDEMIDALRSRLAEFEASQQSAGRLDRLSVKERTSLLKLVIGMASGGYGYDPKATRSPTAREISNDLQLKGIPLDEDTIRKYLAEAKQLLPGDDPEQVA